MKIAVEDSADAKFDMAPMIDMVFLLLIFFMLVSRVSISQNREMELPTATKAAVAKERPDRMIVNVDIAGDVYIGASEATATIDQVREAVRAEATRNPRLKVTIRGDGGSEFKKIREVMNACAEAGVDNVIFTAHQVE